MVDIRCSFNMCITMYKKYKKQCMQLFLTYWYKTHSEMGFVWLSGCTNTQPSSVGREA